MAQTIAACLLGLSFHNMPQILLIDSSKAFHKFCVSFRNSTSVTTFSRELECVQEKAELLQVPKMRLIFDKNLSPFQPVGVQTDACI